MIVDCSTLQAISETASKEMVIEDELKRLGARECGQTQINALCLWPLDA